MLSCLGFGSRPKTKEIETHKYKSNKTTKRDKPTSSATQARPFPDTHQVIPTGALSHSEIHEVTQRTPRDNCKEFTYEELVASTNNFHVDSIIGHGGYGYVYRGKLENIGQEVAVKVLDNCGDQGDKEFLVEVLMLALLRHQNLIKLFGFCAKDNHRILVYEYMPFRSLENRLHEPSDGQKVLNWKRRMRIALGVAKGIEYLHDKANPSVIYRDLKSANILLDHCYRPKLSDFGLAKLGPTGDNTHVTTRIMGTVGYCAPEYANTGKLSVKSDVYSFGVVLLELISGRKAVLDESMGSQRILANWARPLLIKQKIDLIVDPKLSRQRLQFEPTLKLALGVAVSCLHETPKDRPLMSEVVYALNVIVEDILAKEKKMSGGSLRSAKEEVEEDSVRGRKLADAKSWVRDSKKE